MILTYLIHSDGAVRPTFDMTFKVNLFIAPFHFDTHFEVRNSMFPAIFIFLYECFSPHDHSEIV